MHKCGNRNKNSVNLEWKTFKLTFPMDHGIMPKELCVITQKYILEQGYFYIKSKFMSLFCPCSTTQPSNKVKVFTETKMFITFINCPRACLNQRLGSQHAQLLKLSWTSDQNHANLQKYFPLKSFYAFA